MTYNYPTRVDRLNRPYPEWMRTPYGRIASYPAQDAQPNPEFSPNPTAPVGPVLSHDPRRNPSPAPAPTPVSPQAPSAPSAPTPTTSVNPPQSHAAPPSGAPAYPHLPSVTTQYTDATVQQFYESRRALRYYGDNGGIMIAAAYFVKAAASYGVTITETNGLTESRHKIIPWHRIHEFIVEPGDPIMNFTS